MATKKFGPPRNLAPKKFGPQDIWSPNNLVLKKFGPCMKMSQNDFAAGTKILGGGPKKVRSPNEIWNHFSCSPQKVLKVTNVKKYQLLIFTIYTRAL